MASQITHIVYADRFLKQKPIAKDVGEFMLGVLFPDIRYVSNVERRKTHNCFDELNLKFEGLSDFEKGWKFHVWCDLRRNELLNQKGFLKIKEAETIYYINYLLEDQLIWDRFKNWEALGVFLKRAEYKEGLFEELSKADWDFWYQLLADYLIQFPNPEQIRSLIKQIPSISFQADEVVEGVQQLKKNKKIVKLLESLHRELLD